MSLAIDISAKPEGIRVHIDSLTGEVVQTVKGYWGDREIARMSMSDFCVMVGFVLQGSDLWSDKDPRLSFIQSVQRSRVIPGYNQGFRCISLGKPRLHPKDCDNRPQDTSDSKQE